MKLLFLTPQLPYPPQQGTTLRNFNLIKQLAPRHTITLLSFGAPDELQNAAPLHALCERIAIAPYPVRALWQRAWTTLTSPLPDMALRLKSAAMHALVARTLREEQCDVVQVEGIEMARYVLNSQFAIRNSQFVFDDHNAEYVLQRTAFESDAKRWTRAHAALYSLIQWKKLERYERAICQLADHVVACSDTDANHIRALFPNDQLPITTIPNGVDTEFYVPSDEVCAKPLAELALVFTGKMDFRPNIDAMIWFCDEILPRIRAEIPLAHIVIVGQKPAPRVAALAQRDGVQVTGAVPDVRPFIADAAVYVMPLRMGSGTRLKALEAMAMGKAIVSTTRGVEGIALMPERDAVLADEPDAFARAVIALLRDPGRRRALGQSARTLAETRYDWRAIVPAFDEIYAQARKETRKQGNRETRELRK
ncbi:MAG: glycosyltransferase [Chloroflexi bacterium]|nr:glycosyltransferase [Chloroflexota bacterium]